MLYSLAYKVQQTFYVPAHLVQPHLRFSPKYIENTF